MIENTIIAKKTLAPGITSLKIYAPEICAKHKAGQFVILRGWPGGERIPLTIANTDRAKGAITLIFQSVGKTTLQLATLAVGDRVLDMAGPLGTRTHIERFGTVVCIGGGIGTAPLLPITKAMKAAGNKIVTILGFRSRDYIILQNEIEQLSDTLIIITDDGSSGQKGLVTDVLQQLFADGIKIDRIMAIGPAIMMRAVAELTRRAAIPTIASLNPIMIDGTGMCGGCRVTINGSMKFVCVDGPEFDAHQVAWDEVMQRLRTYKQHECRALENYQQNQPERISYAE
ncbi:ferredoxin-NADP reductase [candidate division KSB1 bacterium RBG_16_48_16]|nr:MAG: ferredoxin-NADP reductase [candidate division KSB1 bacterium RBG_16_48_16]